MLSLNDTKYPTPAEVPQLVEQFDKSLRPQETYAAYTTMRTALDDVLSAASAGYANTTNTADSGRYQVIGKIACDALCAAPLANALAALPVEPKKYVPDVQAAYVHIERLFNACGDGTGKLDASWVMCVTTKAMEALAEGIVK